MEDIEPLPETNTQKFTVGPSINCPLKECHFERVKTMEVKCSKCGRGYVLSPECEVKDGHIYIDNMFLI